MMPEQFDISTLAWVKGEIDDTLKQARIALERYVDEPDDNAGLDLCVALIHQVVGTLQMVELGGAALFADEMEQLGSAIKNDQLHDKEQAFELLMRAILQLPDYLENLLDGQKDNPQGLLPLLNEMRQQRGDSLLDSIDFFRPDLSIPPPTKTSNAPVGIDSAVVAKKLHRFYMVALVKVIKGTDVQDNLKIIAAILDKLLIVAEAEQWRRLLWVSAALVESLRNESIGLSSQSKPLLGKFEQLLKVIAAKGETALNDEAVTVLLVHTLYLLARSPSNGKIATEVSQAFGLADYLQQYSGGLGGLNAELKQTVSADIMEELSSVKDAFDVFVRSDRSAIENLGPMAEKLERMAETLRLLQENSLQESLQQQVDIVRQLLAGAMEINDDILMGVAGAVLAVESALRDWGNETPLVKADASEEQVADTENSPQAAAEHLRVTRQVMKEAKDDLVRVREAINKYLENPKDNTVLDNLPSLLHVIIGSLTLLSYKRVAQVLISCRAFIQNELINAEVLPVSDKLDALADAVMSVEYYLEAFVQSRVHPGSVLEVAESAVSSLGYSAGSVSLGMEAREISSLDSTAIYDVENSDTDWEPVDNIDSGELASKDSVGAFTIGDQSSHDMVEELPLSTEEAPLSNDVVDLDHPLEEAEAPQPSAVSDVTASANEQTEEPVVVQSTSNAVDLDDEIIEIFIEEAEEELHNLRELFPKWSENPAGIDTLKDLRRSFHTLKGSGRLVGALELGEFAWAFESLLNRVLDGTISHSSAMFDIVWQGIEALPEMIEQFKSGQQPQSDITSLKKMADEISQQSQGEESATQPDTKPATMQQGPAILNEKEAVPELDPVLLEIYSKEAAGHLDELDAFTSQISAGGSRRVTEPVIRALHTLQGSSRMAGVHRVADVCAKLEKYVKALQASNEAIDNDGIEALAECSTYVRAMLDFLTDGEVESVPENSRALTLASSVFEKVQHLEHMLYAQPEHGLDQVDESVPDQLAVSHKPVQSESSILVDESDAPELASSSDVAEETITFEPVDTLISEGLEAIESVWSEESQTTDTLADTSEASTTTLEHREANPATVFSASAEDYDQELLDIFLEEGADILDASEETLQAWVDNPGDDTLVEELQRQLHTLKGGARMAGITAVGDLSHSLESTVDKVVDGLLAHTPAMMDLLQLSHDRLVSMLEQVKNHEPVTPGDDLIRRVENLAQGNDAVQAEENTGWNVVPETAGTAREDATQEPVITAEDHSLQKTALTAEDELVQESSVTAGDNGGQEQVITAEEDGAQEQTVTPVKPVPDLNPTGSLPEIEPDLSALEQALSDVEYSLSTWMRDINDRGLFDSLRRSGNKLGSVSAEFGINEIVALTDAFVELLTAINDGYVPASKKNSDLMIVVLDRVQLMMTQVKTLEPLDDSSFIVADIREILSIATAELGSREKVVDISKARESIEKADEDDDNRRRAPRIQHEMVRVRADLLDNLVNYAGEVSIYRSRVEQQIGSFRSSIGEMDQTVHRLREQVRQFDIETEGQIESRREEVQNKGYEEFDPLEFDRFTQMQELSRSMVESLSDLGSIENILLNLTRESETLLLQQSRVNTELQESLMHTRMVPLVEYAPRLRRIVRQTSSELGKRATLSFTGADVEMDRNVVERMMAPLEHMVRNSIAHGIEDIQARLATGKPEAGNITIALSREGSEFIVRVSDDGVGINLDAVKKKAIERGLMEDWSKLSDKEIMGFILESGFSTAKSVSQISGRGVGMDVVNSEIKQLGGVLEIDSSPGLGTMLTVRLPLTLSVSRALLVNVAEDVYAIPLMSISGIERISATELASLLNQENPVFTWVGEEYDVLHLTGLLGGSSGPSATELTKHALLLTKSGEQRIAFAIDGLIGSREIVVKSLGPQLSTLQDLAGATILADGSVALIIDMPSLIRRGMARQGNKGSVIQSTVGVPAVDTEPTIMVVDDSITVRKVTERLLKRHNLKCITAKDGIDALSVLDETIPDVMLLDIEMPRMDGFELATHMRNSERLKNIPIIMITSRTGDKHRQRAMDIGVNKYMGKPYTEVDLLRNIETLIAGHS